MKLEMTRGERVWAFFVAAVGLGAALPAVSQSSANDLNTCSAITSQAERLACYDQLAGRRNTPPSATVPPTSPAAASPQPTAAPASARAPGPGTPEAFGLYKAEHPAAPKSPVETVIGKVVGLEYDAYGRETISLEGGAVWQLAGTDALLARGDEVRIRRGALGSYMMTTSTGREHRVKRLR